MKVSRGWILCVGWLLLFFAISATPSMAAAPRVGPPSFSARTPLRRAAAKKALVTVETKAEKTTTTRTISKWKADLLHRTKVGFYFALWYALNIVYNIVNKKVLNVWPAPLTVGSLQLGIGSLYALTLWTLGLRARPSVTSISVQMNLRRVGLWHALGQLCTMMSLGAGPVSFTHIVKALEPFFSAMVSALLLGQWMPIPVYMTLIPVVGGVGYACLKERSFSWLAFGMAMLSNLSFALRAVLSKVAMTTAKSPDYSAEVKNLTAPNVFGLVTMASFVLSLPLVILGEGATITETLDEALKVQDASVLARGVFLSGLFHYLNNEVMYLALGSVHPITLAVGNTMKRVFILVASVVVFRNVITTQAAVGSAIGMSGVLLYSLTKQYYEKEAAAKVAARATEDSKTKRKRQLKLR